ncbi:rod shape-determining protein MreD [Clostridioides mangenotii]|uniref:rod shape-determining protein MreD n=1 Tax=Metaclostridioides mangenotii TaxID=1540 RepID=UPI001C0F93A5|nr:rod shape-determining protein MreD [Clostridioides mangenotii]MBU5307623.1 rod shape-determining protein MreD [Clostridioides mangenotii]MCR1954998.1 rod shape-determining protein MreD [Clostridioides mangenotii]
MKKVLLCLLGLLLVIVENSILNYINILGVSINLILIYIIFISLYSDSLEGGIIAAIVGLLKDITVGGVFGINALILFVVAYVIGYMREKLYKDSYSTIFILVVLATMLDSILNIAMSSIIYHSYGLLTLVLKGLLIAPLTNGIVSLLLYRLSRKLVLKLKED